MVKVANLSADLVANTTKFETGLVQADRALKKSNSSWGRSLQNIDKQFSQLGGSVTGIGDAIFSVKSAFGALFAVAGTGALTGLVTDAFETVGGLGELASQLGITTDTLQAFQYAATQTGLSADEMQAAMGKLTRQIGDAAEGSKSAIDSFDAIGVGVLDAEGKVRSTEAVVRDIADALLSIDDPARRAAIAVDLFGKAGQKMLPFLESGAIGIDEMTAKAKELGLVFSQEDIQSADKIADDFAALATALKTDLYRAILAAGPTVEQFFNDLADGLARSKNQIQQFRDYFSGRDNDTHDLFSGAYLSDLDRLQIELQKAITLRDNLTKESEQWKGLGLNPALAEAERKVADLERRIGIISTERGRRTGAGVALEFPEPPEVTVNPLSSDSSATRNADAVKKRIEDLRFALDQLRRTPIESAVAESLKGIKPDPEQAAEIESLTRQIETLKASLADTSALDRASDLLNQGVADFDARQAMIATIWDATRTPAEQYAAEVARLNELLGGSTETQDLLNRALDAAKEKFENAADGVDVFRDAADEAMGILQAGLVDAAFEADNLSDALSGVLKQLAKMLANKAFGVIADKGLNALFGLFLGTDIPIGPSYKGKAVGGPAGGMTVVGERGPELLNLPAGSYVTPAMRMPGVMGQMVASADIGAPVDRSVNIGEINLHANGGTKEQNNDLVNQFAAKLPAIIDQAVDARLDYNMREGGRLNRGKRY